MVEALLVVDMRTALVPVIYLQQDGLPGSDHVPGSDVELVTVGRSTGERPGSTPQDVIDHHNLILWFGTHPGGVVHLVDVARVFADDPRPPHEGEARERMVPPRQRGGTRQASRGASQRDAR